MIIVMSTTIVLPVNRLRSWQAAPVRERRSERWQVEAKALELARWRAVQADSFTIA